MRQLSSWFRAATLPILLGLWAVPTHADTLTIAWDLSPEPTVAGYVVYIGNAPGAYTQQIDVGNIGTYSVTATPGLQYCFAVSAYVAGPIEGDRSAEVCTTTTGTTNLPPTLVNPGDQNHPVGAALTLTLNAVDPESAPLTFGATGLPAGLSLAATTGTITGSPTAAGTNAVQVSVSDGTHTARQSFTWTITNSAPPAPTLVAPSGPTSTTTPVFEWQPVATATSYRLWIDDNSATNPRVQLDLTPAQANCATTSAQGATCRYNPGVALAAGPASWSVRTTSAAGTSPWSGALDFSIADGRSPVITINTPTSNTTFSTGAVTVAVGGTASDDVGVVQVTWSSDRGGAGTATGTTAWNVPSIPLATGANVITMTARDAENNTSTDVLTITRTDGGAPTVTITLPTTSATHSTTEPTLALGGNANDDFGVTEVRWANSRGGSGIAGGTAQWGVPAVALQGGSNIITVTARDGAGNTGTATLSVELRDGTAPTVAIVSPTTGTAFSTAASTIALSGTASDAFGVAGVTWANSRGGSGTATGTTGWTVASVALQTGDNVITVTARDAAGLSGTDTITITRTDGDAPVVTITTPTANATHTTTQSTIALGGTAVDSFGVTDVTWSSDRGASGSATGTSTWSVASVPLQGGQNIITVTAKDASGRSGTDVITVTRSDGEPPTVTITTPTAADAHSTSTPTVALAGTAADTFGIAQVSWANSRGGSGTATGTTSWSIAGVALQPGVNVITVTARDTSGNTAVDAVTVTLTDSVAPAVTITVPTGVATHSTSAATIALGGTASDLFGVTEVRWASDRGASGLATGTTSWAVATVALAAGANVITVTARDAAGNTATDVLTVTRTDGEAPTVTIVTPTVNPTHSVTSRTIALGGSAADALGVTTVTWSNDRGGSGTATGTTTWSIPSVTLQPGANVLTVVAADAAGNSGRDTVTVTLVDGTAPVVRIAAPTSATSFAASVPTISIAGTASDDFGVSRVSWTNDRGGGGTAAGTTEWSVTGVALRPGTNVLTISAVDAAGNAGTATLSIVATDSTRPIISVASPMPKSRYPTSAATVAVSGTASDDFGLTSITWTNEKGGSGTATGTTSWTVPAVSLQPGVNVINVTATDQAGNTATDTLRVFSDGKKPTVSVTEPTSAATLAVNSTTLTLAGAAADDQGVTEVSWSSNRGGRGVASGTGSWRASGVPLLAGTNEVVITARDEVGNTERAVLTVVVDTRAPAVAIEGPTSSPTHATNAGTVTLRGAANDDVGVTQVTWTSDRGGSGVATGATAWTIRGVPLQLGVNVLTVTARDAAGNTSTDTVVVRYDTRAPVVSIASPSATGTFATTASGLTLGGTAVDDGAVAEVRWTSNRGGAGVASGGASWTVERLALQAGANEIVVTARDEAGNVGTARLVITATDRVAPAVRIIGPSASDTFSTSARVINVDGTTSDDFGVTQVAWASDRGQSGLARGTGSWIAGGIALQPGLNVIAVTALDGAGNSSTDVIRITLDGAVPLVSIVSPASSSYTTASPFVTLSGVASDDAGIVHVTFSSNRGPAGVAIGTTSWATPPVRLERGANHITVTARDTSGNESTAVLRVSFDDAPATSRRSSAEPSTATFSTDRASEPVRAAASVASAGATGTLAPTTNTVVPATSGSQSSSAPSPTSPATPAKPAARAAAPEAPAAPYNWPVPMPVDTGAGDTRAMSAPSVTERARPSETRSSEPRDLGAEPLDAASTQDEPVRPPVVTISAPGLGGTYSTEDPSVTLAGTARHARGITLVTWATDRGASGTAAGRDRWTVPDFAVPVGTTVVTITARNAVGDLASDSITIVRRAKSALGLNITAPTADSAWGTASGTVALRGVASDNVVRVTWNADWGGSGTASGTQTWSIPTIGLQIGANVITVTARDAAGNTERRVVTVNYRPLVAAHAVQ